MSRKSLYISLVKNKGMARIPTFLLILILCASFGFAVISGSLGGGLAETDPVWSADKSNYYTSSEVDSTFLNINGSNSDTTLDIRPNSIYAGENSRFYTNTDNTSYMEIKNFNFIGNDYPLLTATNEGGSSLMWMDQGLFLRTISGNSFIYFTDDTFTNSGYLNYATITDALNMNDFSGGVRISTKLQTNTIDSLSGAGITVEDDINVGDNRIITENNSVVYNIYQGQKSLFSDESIIIESDQGYEVLEFKNTGYVQNINTLFLNGGSKTSEYSATYLLFGETSDNDAYGSIRSVSDGLQIASPQNYTSLIKGETYPEKKMVLLHNDGIDIGFGDGTTNQVINFGNQNPSENPDVPLSNIYVRFDLENQTYDFDGNLTANSYNNLGIEAKGSEINLSIGGSTTVANTTRIVLDGGNYSISPTHPAHFDILGEENGNIDGSFGGFEWSAGNGMEARTLDIAICDGTVYAIAMYCEVSSTTTTEVNLTINQVDQACSAFSPGSNDGITGYTDCNIDFSKNDGLSFRTTEYGLGTTENQCIVQAYARCK